MRGKVVLFDVWEGWCSWCIEAIPEIQQVYEHFRKNDDVVIWGINKGESKEKVRKFIAEHQLPWSILLDHHSLVSQAYQLEGVPNFVLIDKEGRWQYTWEGYGEGIGQEMIWLIEALLQ